MKKRILLIVALLMCLCAQALAAGTVRTTGSVNLRKGPGRNYAKVASVGKGYVLDISDERRHHEIYLSDARRTAPEKLKTVVRHPIRPV